MMNRRYPYDFDDFGEEDYDNNIDYSNSFVEYPENNRYNNAYGNYRGGYDRSNQGPPLGFGPIGPMGPLGPSRPFGPPFPMQGGMRWNQGYAGPPRNAFRAPRRDKIVKYLLRCGIPREHVLKLPNTVLFMMQPMNCGLCAQKFDSTDLSRIHYASKNHLRNQKKWVNQRSDTGAPQNKEPLKSRELYCELCDVQITSTEHAESHYAGKPHRAIVEGRKNARNPFLLQPNKQGRLKALIRREVKCLKKQQTATVKQTSKPDAKMGAPELYCKICKTALMCSEQMTTHLNGKRHLNKEKQHILKVMKGEESDGAMKDASKESTEENVDEAEGLDVNEDEEDEGGEDEGEDEEESGEKSGGEAVAVKESADATAADDDWGEGGEDWKPSAEDY